MQWDTATCRTQLVAALTVLLHTVHAAHARCEALRRSSMHVCNNSQPLVELGPCRLHIFTGFASVEHLPSMTYLTLLAISPSSCGSSHDMAADGARLKLQGRVLPSPLHPADSTSTAAVLGKGIVTEFPSFETMACGLLPICLLCLLGSGKVRTVPCWSSAVEKHNRREQLQP